MLDDAARPLPDDILIPTPSGPLHCLVDGPRHAPCLMFSNSHATNLTMWDRQAKALADRYRVVRYDQRGHGSTPASLPPYSFDALAEDVLNIMDTLGIARATLIGASMGAVTMLRVAARWPQRVNAVVACDGQWRSPLQARQLWAERIEQAQANGMSALATATVARWFRPGFAERAPEVAAAIGQMIEGTSIAGYVGCAQAMKSYDFSGDFPSLKMPILLVVGSHDGALPKAMQLMAAATPHASYVEIDDAGHLPNVEQPERFLEAVLPFIESTRA